MKRRPLTEEELRLWQQVTRHAQPLHGPLHGVQEFFEKEAEALPPSPRVIAPAPRMPKDRGELALGAYANIDRNTAERFRKGDAPIDGRLDLHGMSREKAHRALITFLHAQYNDDSR